MESAKSGQRTISGRTRNHGFAAKPKVEMLARIDHRSLALDRSARASDHAVFADAIYRELSPRGSLETLVADQIVHHAWKLKANLERQTARVDLEKSVLDAEPSKTRNRSTELERASRSMREALESLDYLRGRTVVNRPEPLVPDREDVAEILPNEWPIVPFDEADDCSNQPELEDAEVPTWHDRLIYDFDVSDSSPVVKGTWITVGHVVSLIVDGWTWADILRSHPELIEADIRTCVAYAMAEETTAP